MTARNYKVLFYEQRLSVPSNRGYDAEKSGSVQEMSLPSQPAQFGPELRYD